MNDLPKVPGRPALDRRGVLKLAAATGVLPFLPGTTATAQAAAQATQAAQAVGTAAATCSTLPIISGPEFPIGAFWPPSMQARFNLLERFQEMKDAGFTFSFVGNGSTKLEVESPATVHTTLSFTDQVGLKAIVVNWPLEAIQRRAEYLRHPSFAGFRLDDEPLDTSKFPANGAGQAALRALSPDLLLNINLLPDQGSWREYIHEFVSVVQPDMLSYDRYPLKNNGTDMPNYCGEWREFRAAGLGAGVPTWIYILSVPHLDYRSPSAAELAWQVNVSLAYGCKGIQYFCYWSPEPPGTPANFGPGLIDYEGNRSPLYGYAKTLNKDWLAPAGAQVKPLVSDRVVHANGSVPQNAEAFTPDRFLTGTSGSPVVLGTFRSKDRKLLTRWLWVANWSHANAATATLNVNTTTVSSVSRFDPATRTYAAQASPASIAVSLAPGAAALYRLDSTGTALDPELQLVVATDSGVHHGIQQVGGTWVGPNPLGGPARLVSACERNGALDLMEVTGDSIYHRVRAVDGSWGSRNQFTVLGGITSMSTAVVVGSLQTAFAAGGVVHHTMQYADGRWDGPNRLGDAANLVAATEFRSSFHLVQVEASGRIYHRVRYANGSWSPRNLFATMAGVTSVAITAVGAELMVVIAAGGQLYYAIQHADGGWQSPTQTGDPADQVAASAVGGELQLTVISGGKVTTRRRRADGTLTPLVAVPTTLTNLTAITTAGRSVEHCP
ncbi:hypothetical protein ACFTSF_01080 [Kribbella sp. NPDC056951]|uniref:hypothetical protein n=1 Tax=Kribbella sp. NPDC056951 TaxID=3345978 RepID=UPI0036437983